MTRVLLDTHLLIWSLDRFDRLPPKARAVIGTTDNIVLFSPISIWEIAIKIRLGRETFLVQPDAIAEAALATGFVELRPDWRAAAQIATLPMHHRDPFDRMLIAQAAVESVPLYTVDQRMAAYGRPVHRV